MKNNIIIRIAAEYALPGVSMSFEA